MAASGNEPVAGARLEIGASEKQLEKGLDASISIVHKFTQDANRAFGQMGARIQGYVDKIDATDATVRLGLLEQAVAKLGGASNLTAPQLTRVQQEVMKLAEQGGRLPPALQAIHDQFLKGKDAAAKAADTYKLASEKTAEAKRNLDAALGRIGALSDQFSGKAAGREMAELAKAVEAAGGASKLSAPALDTVRQRLVTLQAAGAKVPPALQAINKETDKLTAAAKAAASGQGWSGILGAISPQAVAAAAGVTGLAAAAAAAGEKIGKAVLQTAGYAANIRNLSESYNMNAHALQRLGAAAADSDVPLQTVLSASKNIAKELIDAPDKFRQLGLSVEQLLAMSPDEQFFAVAEALRDIKNETQQTAAAQDLLGKGGSEILRMLKSDMRGAADEAERMGRIMGTEQLRAAAELKDELDKLDQTLQGLTRNAASLITGNENLAQSVRALRDVVGDLSRFTQEHQDDIPIFFNGAANAATTSLPAVRTFLVVLRELNDQFDKMRARREAKDIELPGGERRPPRATVEVTEVVDQLKTHNAIAKIQEAAAKRHREIAARNRELDGKASAEAMERERKRAEELSNQLLQIQVRELAIRKGITKDAALSAIEAERKTSDWLRERAKNDADVIVKAEAVKADAKRLGMSAIGAQISKIEEATEAAIRHVDALEDEGKIGKEAAEKARDVYEEAADAEIRYAKQLEAINKIGNIRDLFAELVGLLEDLGVEADSGLGKAASAGLQYLDVVQHNAKAAAAAMSGDFVTATLESIKSIRGYIGIIKTLFSEPSWKKVGREAGRVLGMEISEELAKTIEKTAKELGIDIGAASLLNLSKAMEESGRGARDFGDQIVKLISGIAEGTVPAKQGIKELGNAWAKVREEADRAGIVGDRVTVQILQAARATGQMTAEMTAFVSERLEAAGRGLTSFISTGLGLGALRDAQAYYDQIKAKLDALNKAKAEGVAIDEKEIENLKYLLWATGKKLENKQGGIAMVSEENARDQATIFTTVFWSTVKEKGITQAVDSLRPAFESLTASITDLFGEDLAAELLGPVGRVMDLAAEGSPFRAAAEGAQGLTEVLRGLADTGYLTTDSFAAIQRQAMTSFDQMVEGGATTQEALMTLAPTIQAAVSAAEQFGIPLSADMQRLRGLAEQNGITFRTDPMERMVDILTAIAVKLGADLPAALDRSAASAEAFGARTTQVFDETAAGAERMTDDVVTTWDEGVLAVQLRTEQMGQEMGQEITDMADAAETVFGYMTDDLEGSLSEWPGIAGEATDDVQDMLSRLPSGISIPIDFPLREPDRSRFPDGDRGSEREGYAFGGIEDFGRESIIAVHGREAIVPEGGAWFMDMLRQAVREGGGGGEVQVGPIYVEVHDSGGNLNPRRVGEAVVEAIKADYAEIREVMSERMPR